MGLKSLISKALFRKGRSPLAVQCYLSFNKSSKVAYGETGRVMLHGEFELSKAIYKLMADFIPQPFGFGQSKVQSPATYFYLSEFVDMDVTTAPDPVEFTSRLAEMHRTSQSPTGKFGFHVQTCDGDRAHIVDWEESWAIFYRNLFLGVCKLDLERNGPWPEFERSMEQVAWKVIPRLLEPLQAKGRHIKPCIIHGDLWEGNMGINMETGDTPLRCRVILCSQRNGVGALEMCSLNSGYFWSEGLCTGTVHAPLCGSAYSNSHDVIL
jgi:hypothetical protein